MKKNIGLVILLCGILLFAFLPHKDIPNKIDIIDANILHMLAFSILSLYLYIIKNYTHQRVFLFVLSTGIFIEVVQGVLTTNREASVYDILFDVSAYLVVALLVLVKEKISKI